MDIEQKTTKKHSVHLIYGDCVEITGVICALEYDETLVVFKLVDNVITVRGHNFDVKTLDIENGTAVIKGTVSSIEYSKNREKQGFMKRLLK